jgi:D-tagatose-1,6-bisphosphate aldolase subunit GatZ/KbaZ
VPVERVWLNGDHLGPIRRSEPAAVSMARAGLVEQFVAAGFRKLPRCSMPARAIIAHRVDGESPPCFARRRCTWQRVGGEAPVSVIGTEVPARVPTTTNELRVTTPEAACNDGASRVRGRRVRGHWPRALALVATASSTT